MMAIQTIRHDSEAKLVERFVICICTTKLLTETSSMFRMIDRVIYARYPFDSTNNKAESTWHKYIPYL